MKDVSQVYNRQKQYFFDKMMHTSVAERIAVLKQVSGWITSNKEELYRALFDDLKKPEVEVDITDVKPLISEIKHVCGNLRKWAKPKSVRTPIALLGSRSRIYTEPLGVSLIIAPWNYPILLSLGPLISAIAAGNTVVLKPSEHAPSCARLLEKFVNELFCGDGVEVVAGGVDVSKSLLEQPFDHVFFTGSTIVGKEVMKAASANLTKVTLELGGANPCIVTASADLHDAVEKIWWGRLENAGQRCLAPNHVYVHESVYEEFVKSATLQLKRYYGEEPTWQSNKDFGRIINKNHLQRLEALIEELKSEGGKIVCGGNSDANDLYLAPTLIRDLKLRSMVTDNEVFGPVLALIPYKEERDLVAALNKKAIPLCIYVFARQKSEVNYLRLSTRSGTMGINETTLQFVHSGLPFGGLKDSGMGYAHGRYGYEAFSHKRAVLKQRVGFTTLKLIMPPYTSRVKWLMDIFIKYF